MGRLSDGKLCNCAGDFVFDKLTGRDENGKLNWGKMWKLGKMAVKTIFDKNSEKDKS